MKTGKTNKVGKNTETANTKTNKETHFKQVSAITNRIRSIGGFFTKIVKKVRELIKKHPEKSSAALVVLKKQQALGLLALGSSLAMILGLPLGRIIGQMLDWRSTFGVIGGVATLIALLMYKLLPPLPSKNAGTLASVPILMKRPLLMGIYLLVIMVISGHFTTYSYIEPFIIQISQFSPDITTLMLFKEQKDLVKKAEQNCQENHSQFFIKKLGIKGGIAIEVEAECKTPKPAKTNQTPIQPKHLPNSKQPHSQRGSKAQELIAYLQKELESLPYSQKAIAKQVDFYKPSSIAYLELDPRDFKVTEEWQKENLKIRSKAQAKMLEMRNPQAHLSTSQSLLFVQKIFADINKGIEAAANTEKKAEKVSYGYSKRM